LDGWYYTTDNGKIGPVPIEALVHVARHGGIVAKTLVRQGALGGWIAAGANPAIRAVLANAVIVPPNPAMWYYVGPSGVTGPMDANALRRAVTDELIKPETPIRRNEEPWIRARQVKGLLPDQAQKEITEAIQSNRPIVTEKTDASKPAKVSTEPVVRNATVKNSDKEDKVVADILPDVPEQGNASPFGSKIATAEVTDVVLKGESAESVDVDLEDESDEVADVDLEDESAEAVDVDLDEETDEVADVDLDDNSAELVDVDLEDEGTNDGCSAKPSIPATKQSDSKFSNAPHAGHASGDAPVDIDL